MTPIEFAVEAVGWAGALLILLGYLLITTGRLTGKSLVYQAMNVFGAAGFAINGWWHQDRFFLDCVREGRPVAFPASNLEDAVKTMELIDMIRDQWNGPVA